MQTSALETLMTIGRPAPLGFLLMTIIACHNCTSDDAPAVCAVDEIVLAAADSAMHPEGIAATSDGTLYVSGFLDRSIVRVTPCGDGPERFVAAGALGNVAGLLVDEAEGALWACHSDFGQMPPNPRVSRIDLASGAILATHAFPAGSGICNDLTRDGAGHLYLTDSFANRIVRIAADDLARDGELTDTATVWSADSAFGTLAPMTFGLNGIAWAGGSDLYVVAYHGNAPATQGDPLLPSQLYRVPMQADGSAGAAVVVGTIPFGDGLEHLDGTRFLVNEQSSTVSILDLADGGVRLTPVASGLDFSTTSALVGDAFWVVEGQLDHFLDPSLGPATEPFRLRRFDLP